MLSTIARTVNRMIGGRLATRLREKAVRSDQLPPAKCPCCGFEGQFISFGLPIRAGVQCPRCISLERHRLLALALDRGAVDMAGFSVLHFAPEPIISRLVFAQGPSRYATSSYPDKGNADFALNIEAIDLPDGLFDFVICNHVLEHVDDSKALSEIYRVLAPDGLLVAMVPIVEGWAESYEDPAITDRSGRTDHFGQYDHVRYYGADFRDRIEAAGFTLDEFTASGADSVTYRLMRGEKVFLGRK